MPGMSIREFECSLCGQPFTMSSGDLMVPHPDLCDECWREVWDMDDEALTEHVVACLARGESVAGEALGAPSEEQAAVNSIVQYIKSHTEHYGEAEEVIRQREWARGMLGG